MRALYLELPAGIRPVSGCGLPACRTGRYLEAAGVRIDVDEAQTYRFGRARRNFETVKRGATFVALLRRIYRRCLRYAPNSRRSCP